VQQIEATKTIAGLDVLWTRAEEIGVVHRIESAWRSRRRKLQEKIQQKVVQMHTLRGNSWKTITRGKIGATELGAPQM